jgi:hypothetical protein
MSKTKKSPATSNYVQTIREGAIAANIFRGTTPDGHTYLYFEISRSWKSQASDRQGYSKKFYDRNQEALVNVVNRAAQWLQEHPEAADTSLAETANSGDAVKQDTSIKQLRGGGSETQQARAA